MMNYKESIIRLVMLTIGISLMTLGISLSIIAGLGTTPISVVPYVLSLGFTKLSVGEWTIIFNILLIILQIIILKKDFDYKQLSQLLILILFGYTTDLWLWILKPINLNCYFLQWVFCLLGCFILAFGLLLEIKAELTVLPPDGLVQAICKRTKREFGLTKPYFDVSIVIIGSIASFILFNKLVGVREGTIVAAVIIGYILKGYEKLIGNKLDEIIDKLKN